MELSRKIDYYESKNENKRRENQMDKFMRRAVKLSAQNVREGGQPFGAVLVKDGEVITEGVNELHIKYDSSGHAELIAIRKAQEKLQTHDLSDCIMYASGEPCPMCLSLMYMAGIKEVYYCATIEDAGSVGLGASKDIYDDLKKENEDRRLVMQHMPLESNQEDPMSLWEEKEKSKG